jgi:hypothetical protein
VQGTATTRLEPISPENLARAHAQLEGGRTLGKIVLAGWESGAVTTS